ncbi:hypothetical protein AVEN_108818-1 [Araneus ventricosus]|uniref:Transposase Tc1-like domain-containing protein n=1 Tax=Araneus ventricosus TaxID=182803 RepID=A0A4Y2CE92_ARAVE|nr:hypothetical protein AVEN_108818-1 [Araneus ventricosus]
MQVQAQVFRNTQFSGHCWIWDCAADVPLPLLTKPHRQLRLQWAREHRDWTMDEWKRVAWSDESRFLNHHVDGRVRVRRLLGEQLLPSCTAGFTQAGGGGIML